MGQQRLCAGPAGRRMSPLLPSRVSRWFRGVMAAGALALGVPASADVTITFTDDGTATTASYSGSLDTNVFGPPVSRSAFQPTPYISPSAGWFGHGFYNGVTRWTNLRFVRSYGGAGSSWGYGSGPAAAAGAPLQYGGVGGFLFIPSSNRLEMPSNYISGTPIKGYVRHPSLTVADFGIVDTEYTLPGGQRIIIRNGKAPVDSDGDGVPDDEDAFPNDPNEWVDTDGDGVGDNGDAFPNDPRETDDTDGDGVGDNSDAFPLDPKEWKDTDGDGVGDNGDAFPNDPTETTDTDGDGVGDNSDAFPNDPTETDDTDGDGVGDNSDVFPLDPAESADSDGDGVGDNADQNDDSDLSETLIVGGSDTGVLNLVNDQGLSMQDYINVIEAVDYKNHGQYVSTISHFAKALFLGGVITEEEAAIIIACAARSDIGKKNGGNGKGK